MISPKCNRCGNELPDWQANVMVDDQKYMFNNIVDRLEIVCKPCTKAMDNHGNNRTLHNLLELTWFRDSFLRCLAAMLHDHQAGSKTRWEDKAREDFFNLAALRFPELTKDPFAIPSD